MKHIVKIGLIGILIYSCSIKICASSLKEQQYNPNNVEYSFGAYKLNKTLYIKSIRNNVAKYLDAKGWNNECRKEFINAYNTYLNALNDPTAPYRLSTNEFGTILDSKRQLSNEDKDDFWYDEKGNQITGAKYRSLNERKKKKYKSFQANREVATYFYKIAKELAEKMESEGKKR